MKPLTNQSSQVGHTISGTICLLFPFLLFPTLSLAQSDIKPETIKEYQNQDQPYSSSQSAGPPKALIGPRSARPHNAGGKFSWGFTSLIAADASVRALDTYSTHLMLSRGNRELFLPKWIADSTPRMAAYSGLCVVGNALVAHWLVKHKRRRMADMYLAGDAAQDAPWAIHNLYLKGKR